MICLEIWEFVLYIALACGVGFMMALVFGTLLERAIKRQSSKKEDDGLLGED